MKLRSYWKNIYDRQNKHICKVCLSCGEKAGKGDCHDLGLMRGNFFILFSKIAVITFSVLLFHLLF